MSGGVLGVIGGLGPLATARFLELTALMTDAPTEQDGLPMIVYNFPDIPDRTGYILGSNLRSPLPGLLSVGRELDRQDVRCIAIPCVTAHFFHEELTEGIHTPILHGVRETVRHLKENGVSSAGVMATDGTIFSGLFTQELLKADIRPVLPTQRRQADVTHLIYNNIKAGIPAEMDRFCAVEEELRRRGAEAIILGCTELSLIKRDHSLGSGYLDAMEVLAKKAIEECGKSVKENYRCLVT